jgi:hypothetical protein
MKDGPECGELKVLPALGVRVYPATFLKFTIHICAYQRVYLRSYRRYILLPNELVKKNWRQKVGGGGGRPIISVPSFLMPACGTIHLTHFIFFFTILSHFMFHLNKAEVAVVNGVNSTYITVNRDHKIAWLNREHQVLLTLICQIPRVSFRNQVGLPEMKDK